MLLNKNILALAPHFDDIELGCFATLHKFSADNTIYYAGFSYSAYGKSREAIDESIARSTSLLHLPSSQVKKYVYDPRNFYKSRKNILQDL